jgi:hypothetical protein
MVRFLAPLAVAATIAATGALAQTPTPIHKATIGDVKVSGVVATNANTGTASSGLDSVTNLLDKFSVVQPATPVLTAPGNSQQPGASKDCVGPSC